MTAEIGGSKALQFLFRGSAILTAYLVIAGLNEVSCEVVPGFATIDVPREVNCTANVSSSIGAAHP